MIFTKNAQNSTFQLSLEDDNGEQVKLMINGRYAGFFSEDLDGNIYFYSSMVKVKGNEGRVRDKEYWYE